jgi:thioesterase domain-containing protein
MASRYLAEIRAVQPAGPYLLGGICLGAMVAYEMARLLAAAGEPAAFVGVLDTSADSFSELEVSQLPVEAGIASELGIPLAPEALEALAPEARLPHVVAEGLRSLALPAGFTLADARRYLEIFRLNYQALSRYTPPASDGRVTLFASPEAELPAADPTHGWAAVARGGVEVIPVEGDQATMLKSPLVEQLAARLEAALEATVATDSTDAARAAESALAWQG